MNIFDVRENLDSIVFDHDQQIKDLAAHLLELKQLVTPMMEFKQPTKICGPNLEEVLNAAGFYRKKEWVGLTDDEVMILNRKSYDAQIGLLPLTFYRAIEAKLREKNI